jgi:hypothetical protein
MRDLVFHLVLDARDAMPHGGSLSIVIERRRIDKAHVSTHLEPTGDYVMVAVRDISTQEENAEIPERGDFRIVKGRSLSLAASYAIKRCGGHISVSRRAGETVVRIYLSRLAVAAILSGGFRQRLAVVRG